MVDQGLGVSAGCNQFSGLGLHWGSRLPAWVAEKPIAQRPACELAALHWNQSAARHRR